MTTERIIQCIGPTEEDRAHLRLLLRVARNQLRDSWAWGTEAKADLVIVDTRRLMGDAAMRRANQRGIACAQIIGEKEPKPTGLFLRKPFRRDAFVMLLNRIGRDALMGSESDIWSDEMFELDLGPVDLTELEAEHPGVSGDEDGEDGREPTDAQAASGEPEEPPGPIEFDEAVDEGDGVDAAFGHAEQADADTGTHAAAVEPVDENAAYPLVYFLERGMLGGPSRVVLRGSTSLVVDPEDQLFWAQGLLRGLEAYVREPLRLRDWQRLDRLQFREATSGIAARPYSRLIWLDRFVHSDGFLARHFDPGGTFRLTNRFDLSLDYPRAFRVAAQMTVPRRLHEVARASAVGLAEVFDVVNAYEAVGYVECVARDKPPALK